MTTTTDIGPPTSARVLSARTRADLRRGLGAVHRLVRRHRHHAAPRRPADGRRVPDRMPRRAGHPAVPGRRHRPPPHRPRIPAAGGVGGGAGRARPTHRRTLPPHGKETGRRWRRRCAGCPPTAGPPACSAAGTGACSVLSQLAGVPYRHLATLTAGDVHIEEGVATIRSAAGEWTIRSGRRRGLVRAVRGRPLAEDPGPGRHQTQHQDHRPSLEEGRGGGSPVAARLPHRAGPRRQHEGRAAAAADRPMGRPAPPAATALPALAVPPRPGPPGRGPRRAPRPARRPRPGTGGRRAEETAGHQPGAAAPPTTRRTRPRPGSAAAATCRTWAGSSTCSPTSNDAPTNSTAAPPNWSRTGCRCVGFVGLDVCGGRADWPDARCGSGGDLVTSGFSAGALERNSLDCGGRHFAHGP